MPHPKLHQEIQRFKNALGKTREEFSKIKERLCRYEGTTQIRILDSYQMFLQDDLLVKNTLESIKSERINAEWALTKTLKRLKNVFLNFDEEYFRERANDVDTISERIIKSLMGKVDDAVLKFPPHSIVVAQDLSPADTAQLTKFRIGGLLTEMGGKTSHTAIIARALHLPAVVACTRITKKVNTGDEVIVDGNRGLVILNPTREEIEKFEITRKRDETREKMFLKEIHLSTETQDGFRISLVANMEISEEMDSIKLHGAEGIGLYRTEFLYLNRPTPPSEEELFQNYKQVIKSMYPHSTTFRTLDIGGDKIPTEHKYEKETNPALGIKGVRLYLKEKEIFLTQLRALLRASAYGEMKILIPMISNRSEILQVKQLLAQVRQELDHEKIPYAPQLKLGIMIEIPSAVMIAEDLAKEVDFFSIGTNDLIQYTLGVDRTNENVAYLYRPLHPAILRMMKRVVDIAHEHRIEVGICGEMASEPLYIMILLGLGFHVLSMNAVSIPRVKKIIRSVQFKDAKTLLDHVLEMNDEGEIESFIRKEMRRLLPEEPV